MLLDKRKRNWELKFNAGLALIYLRTNGAQDSSKAFHNPESSRVQRKSFLQLAIRAS